MLQDGIPLPGGVRPPGQDKGVPWSTFPMCTHLLTLPSGAEAPCPHRESMHQHSWIRQSFADLQMQEGSVLPEQDHMEGAKCTSSPQPRGSSGLSWCSLEAAAHLRGEPCVQAVVFRSSFSFSLNPQSKPFPFAGSLCKH